VVASAGIISYGPAWELLDEQWDDVISVNLTGAWRICKAAIPAVLARGESPGGAIVLVASVTALRGMRGVAHYSAAKHGLLGLLQTLAVELAPHGIRVNAVCPTIVDTPMMNNSYLTALTEMRSGEPYP
jgi:NAD(P)-dependent dehydrogenase (short-subunit alcohol dehydrogenase family)